jgi:hypothetical protein
MKGGTAINLFVQDMPRLSVDIDVVYLPWQVPRDDALRAINQELATISARVETLGVQTRLVRSRDLGDTKLIVENETSQVKVEVNVVFRGTVLPVERRALSARTGDWFGVEFEVPILARTNSMRASWRPRSTGSTRAICSTYGSSTNRAASPKAWWSASWSIWPDTIGQFTKYCSATTRILLPSTTEPSWA